MNKEQIILSAINEWEEHIEMNPGNEWSMVALVIAHKLEKQLEETEYYKRLANARVSAK